MPSGMAFSIWAFQTEPVRKQRSDSPKPFSSFWKPAQGLSGNTKPEAGLVKQLCQHVQ